MEDSVILEQQVSLKGAMREKTTVSSSNQFPSAGREPFLRRGCLLSCPGCMFTCHAASLNLHFSTYLCYLVKFSSVKWM